MSQAYLPLPCRCALENWESHGERTKARLNGLVEHYVKAYGLTDTLAELQEKTIACVPSWKWAEA